MCVLLCHILRADQFEFDQIDPCGKPILDNVDVERE